jgi:hypothetical protein
LSISKELNNNERTIIFLQFEEVGGFGSGFFSSIDADKSCMLMFNIVERKANGVKILYITGFEKSDFGTIFTGKI